MTGTDVVPASYEIPKSIEAKQELAKVLAVSDLLPGHLRGKPANIFLCLFAAEAYQMQVWTALQTMHVIDGKVGLPADYLRKMVIDAGHTWRVIESTTKVATIVGIRKDDPDRFEHRATYTLAEAETGGLLGKANWKKSPADMLVARATTRLIRFAFSDVTYGPAYTPEELGDDGEDVQADLRRVTRTADDDEPIDAEIVADRLDEIEGQLGIEVPS